MKVLIDCRSISKDILYRIVYRIILDLAYAITIVPYWSFSHGFTFEFDFVKCLQSYGLAVILSLFTPSISKNVINIFLNLQLYITIMPMLTLYAYSERQMYIIVFIVLVHVLQCIISLLLTSIKLSKSSIKYRHSEKIVYLLCFSITGVVLVWTFANIGLLNGLKAFNFLQVYEIREVSDEQLGGILGYFQPWVIKIIIPFGMSYALCKKKKGLLLCLCVVQLYIYSAFASKSIFFTVFLVIGVWIILKFNMLKWLFRVGMILYVGGITVVDVLLSRMTMLSSYLLRRVLFVPASVKYYYYDFFENRDKVYYADGTIGAIFGVQPKYTKPIPLLIAEHAGLDAYLNTGYLGETFANAGFIGVILISVLLVVYLCLIERYLSNQSQEILIITSMYLLYSFGEGGFFTIMLTYGGLLFLLICFLMDFTSSKSVSANESIKHIVWNRKCKLVNYGRR